MSYQLFFRNYNYRISTTLSRTSHAFQSTGNTMNQWYSLSKKYYISPLVYCNAWHILFSTEEKLNDPLLYYDDVIEPVSEEDDSVDVQDESFVSETIVQKRRKQRKRGSKKVNFNRRRK